MVVEKEYFTEFSQRAPSNCSSGEHRITEPIKLERTSEIIESNLTVLVCQMCHVHEFSSKQRRDPKLHQSLSCTLSQ